MTDGLKVGDFSFPLNIREVLRIAPRLDLPLDTVTQSIAILARKGMGKTYTAGVLAEEMLAADLQVVIIDPVGVWHGLRSTAAGKPGPYSVYIFGGDHGDVPLEDGAGVVIADFVVESRASVILDTSHLSKTKSRRFVMEFTERLYQHKSQEQYRTPVHVFIDEADLFCPQRGGPEIAQLLGAIEDIVRRGRARGIGTSLISQRPQVVNKDVLTQCELLLCGQLIHKLDRKAVEDWVEAHDATDQMATFMGSLASMKPGDVWAWSPSWLDIFERVHIRVKRTYDSSRTPKPGEVMAPAAAAAVDLDALRGRIAETVAQAKANDPAELRKTIADLRRQIASSGIQADAQVVASYEAQAVQLREERDEALTDGTRNYIAYESEHAMRVQLHDAVQAALSAHGVERELQAVAPLVPAVTVFAGGSGGSAPPRHWYHAPGEGKPVAGDDTDLTPYRKALLTAVAQRYPAPSTKSQIAVLSGKSIKSSVFGPNLSALVDAGYVIVSGGHFEITATGRLVLGDYEAPPTGAALVDWWMSRITPGEQTFLRALVAVYPRYMARDEIARATGRSLGSSTFNPQLNDLVERQLAERDTDGTYRAAASLMEAAA